MNDAPYLRQSYPLSQEFSDLLNDASGLGKWMNWWMMSQASGTERVDEWCPRPWISLWMTPQASGPGELLNNTQASETEWVDEWCHKPQEMSELMNDAWGFRNTASGWMMPQAPGTEWLAEWCPIHQELSESLNDTPGIRDRASGWMIPQASGTEWDFQWCPWLQ